MNAANSRTSRLIVTVLPILGALAACGDLEHGNQPESSQPPEFGSTSEAQIIGPPPPNCQNGFHKQCTFAGGGRSCHCVRNPAVSSGPPNPGYLLISISYAPPGNLSEVDYSDSTSTGSNIQVQSQFTVGFESMAFGSGEKFKGGIVGGNQKNVQFTSTTGTSLLGPPNSDTTSHDKDVFYVWTNPWIENTTYFDGTTPAINVTSIGPMNIESVTAAELQGLVPIPSYKVVSTYSDQDKMAILKRNPFFSDMGLDLSSPRYQYKTSINLFGPDNPGDPLTAQTYSLSNSQSTGMSIGWSLDLELDVGASFLGVGGKVDFEFQYQSVKTDLMGTQTDAALSLSSSTVCLHAGYDVYLDTAFNTFIFMPRSTLSGSGAPSGFDCCNSPHSVCDSGVPLDPSCQANGCLQTVCGEDPYCCNTQWDGTCVAEANSCSPQVCGM